MSRSHLATFDIIYSPYNSRMQILTSFLSAAKTAVFWALVLLLGGAATIAVGVGLEFGVSFGLIAGGAFAVAYGAYLVRGLTNG